MTDRPNLAIAGLSMGGAQTLTIAIARPKDFAYVATGDHDRRLGVMERVRTGSASLETTGRGANSSLGVAIRSPENSRPSARGVSSRARLSAFFLRNAYIDKALAEFPVSPRDLGNHGAADSYQGTAARALFRDAAKPFAA